jgi:hypothetical protein
MRRTTALAEFHKILLMVLSVFDLVLVCHVLPKRKLTLCTLCEAGTG